jgi:hypothetical protein
MTIKEVAERLQLETLVTGNNSREVSGGYCGDLLSWVMSRAQAGNVWITIMGNVNSIAVAVLTDVSCILLAEGSVLDENAEKRAEMQQISILRSDKSAYQLAVELEQLINK